MDSKQKHTQLLYYILLLLLLILFREPISSLIDIVLVNPVLGKVSSNLTADLTILLSLAITVYLFWNTKDHKWILKYSVALLILFAIYRFGDSWSYTPIYLLKNERLKYIDLSAISVVILFIRHWYQLCVERQGHEPGNSFQSGFVEDNSIRDEKDDTYERLQVAEQIASQILGTRNEKSFAIGITGIYGSGKSSFINLICGSLKKDLNPPLLIHFNPWDASTSADLQKFFFDELSSALAKEDSALSSRLYSYYRRLNGKNTFIGDLINNLKDLFVVFNRDLDDEKKKINEMMKTLPRKVIIIIDDLDRLHNDEVIEVLRLIRNTANFGNITYIVAYDRQYVEQSIKTLNERSYKNYLDKIFQIEIPLPKSETHFITDSLIKSLENIVKPDELTYLRDNFITLNFDSDYEEAITSVFKNHRDIIRFVNNFSISYSMIAEEVDFVQLFYIEILKHKYPTAYEMLYDRRNEVLKRSENINSYTTTHSLREGDERYDRQYLILDFLKDEFSPYNLKQIKHILNHLFHLNLTLRYESKTRTITNPEVFELFFTGRISSSDLSKSDFVKKMLGDANEVDQYVTDQLKRGKHKQLVKRILETSIKDFANRARYEEILYALVQRIAPIYIEKEGFRSFPFQKFITEHIDNRQAITKHYYDGHVSAFGEHLSRLLSFHHESYSLISEIARKIIVREGNSANFPTRFFLDIQLECLVSGLDKGSIISSQVTWLFWGIRNYHLNQNEEGIKSWNIHPEAVEILLPRLRNKDMKYFLSSLISKGLNSDNQYVLNDKLIEDVFKDALWLKEIIKANKHTDEAVKNEFWEFLYTYENAKSAIEFEFKHLDIK